MTSQPRVQTLTLSPQLLAQLNYCSASAWKTKSAERGLHLPVKYKASIVTDVYARKNALSLMYHLPDNRLNTRTTFLVNLKIQYFDPVYKLRVEFRSQ
jgi:hypothetical protein